MFLALNHDENFVVSLKIMHLGPVLLEDDKTSSFSTSFIRPRNCYSATVQVITSVVGATVGEAMRRFVRIMGAVRWDVLGRCMRLYIQNRPSRESVPNAAFELFTSIHWSDGTAKIRLFSQPPKLLTLPP